MVDPGRGINLAQHISLWRRAAPQCHSILRKPRLGTPMAKYPAESGQQSLWDAQHQEQVFKEPAYALSLPRWLNLYPDIPRKSI